MESHMQTLRRNPPSPSRMEARHLSRNRHPESVRMVRSGARKQIIRA
jgi:hypothetical protein